MNWACANASASRPSRVTEAMPGRAEKRPSGPGCLSDMGPGTKLSVVEDRDMIGDTSPHPVPPQAENPVAGSTDAGPVAEVGGREGPDPTRYGDWEKNGRCIDF
ncbi:succinate dehydrogenase assembly factor 4 [Luteimonas kalidii]